MFQYKTLHDGIIYDVIYFTQYHFNTHHETLNTIKKTRTQKKKISKQNTGSWQGRDVSEHASLSTIKRSLEEMNTASAKKSCNKSLQWSAVSWENALANGMV